MGSIKYLFKTNYQVQLININIFRHICIHSNNTYHSISYITREMSMGFYFIIC